MEKYIPELIYSKIDFDYLPEIPSLEVEITQRADREIAFKREEQIKEALKSHGYEFKSEQELHNFAKTRCTIEKYPNKLHVLKVDNTYICEWWDTISISTHDRSEFKVIAGQAP